MTTIHHGDALSVLRTLPAESVQCVVTSPPYFGLRDYGVDRQLGREFVGIELNPDYIRMAVRRIECETGLLGPVRVVAEKQEAMG